MLGMFLATCLTDNRTTGSGRPGADRQEAARRWGPSVGVARHKCLTLPGCVRNLAPDPPIRPEGASYAIMNRTRLMQARIIVVIVYGAIDVAVLFPRKDLQEHSTAIETR